MLTSHSATHVNGLAASMSKRLRSLFAMAVMLLLVSTSVLTQASSVRAQHVVPEAEGDLDATFGNGGAVRTDFFGQFDLAHFVAIQSDSKIVVVGSATKSSSETDFAVARYNTDGSLDTAFGSGGKVTTDFSGQPANALSGAIQRDGKIIAAGFAFSPTTGNDFALIRYNIDGSLDTSFGAGGKVTTDFFGRIDSFGDQLTAIALQPDGKIVAAGVANSNSFPFGQFAVARYNLDGSLDMSFGSGGKVTTVFDKPATGLAIAIQPDGRIVVGGGDFTFDTNGTALPGSSDFVLARYNSDGSLDTSFGTGGKLINDFFGLDDELDALVIQPNGKILAAGTATSSASAADFALVRYNPDGSFDTSFGSGGKVFTDFHRVNDLARAMSLRADGKIVLAGFVVDLAGTPAIGVARYNADGSLDSTFGTGGLIFITVVGQAAEALGVAIQQDGKIVVAGGVGASHTQVDFLVVRFLSNPPPGDFTLSSSPPSQTVGPGGSASFTVSAQATASSPSTPIGLAASVAPSTSSISASFNPASVSTGGSASLNVATALNTPLGTYTITITGTAGAITHTTSVTLIVAAPDFTIGFDSPMVTAQAGTKARVTVLINRTGGFTGNVTVTPPAPSGGIKPKPADSIATTDNTVTFKMKIGGGVAPGPHPLTFTGMDGSGRTRTATVTLNVQ